MSDILQLLIQTNTLNFLIVLFLIIFLVIKLNLKDKIEVLRSEIKDYVDASVNEKEQSDKDLEIIKKKVDKLPLVIEKIQKSTENSVKNLGEKIKNEIEEQKKDIENNAERIFNLETKKFKEKLTSLLSEKSVEIARENALNQLNQNNDLHNKYIDNAIDEIDRITL